MLRTAAILLLLANAVYFAWAQQWLAQWGFAPVQQREPQRVEQQLRPEALRILAPREAAEAQRRNAPAAQPAAAECLQAGLFDTPQAQALQDRLAQLELPAGSWVLEPATQPGRWIVYMGRYESSEQLDKKKAELRYRKVSFEAPRNAALEPGLSLGGYASQAEAQLALDALGERGVRTARVVVERPAVQGQLLRLPAVDDALRARLDALKPALAGRPLRSCG